MSFLDTKYKRRGALATVLLHTLLAILFLLYGLVQPNPLPEEVSMEIAMDFGMTEMGMGDIESLMPNPEVEEVETPQAVQEVVEEATPEQVETQEEVTHEVVEPVETEEERKEREAREEYKRKMNAINWNDGATSGGGGGEGNDNTLGNTGNPNGNDGKGVLGNGIGYDMAGRSMVVKPVAPTGFQEEGTVVVKIKIGRDGSVIVAKIDYQRSTTSSTTLHKLATKSAVDTMFNAKSDAKAEQWGTLTYNFKLSGG